MGATGVSWISHRGANRFHALLIALLVFLPLSAWNALISSPYDLAKVPIVRLGSRLLKIFTHPVKSIQKCILAGKRILAGRQIFFHRECSASSRNSSNDPFFKKDLSGTIDGLSTTFSTRPPFSDGRDVTHGGWDVPNPTHASRQ